jgi:limonene-1,2-epoxide hydrolase
VKGLAVSGDRVFSERVDYHYDADGHMGHAPEICGVMMVEDGKVKHWRGYFDSRELLEHVDLESYRRDTAASSREMRRAK